MSTDSEMIDARTDGPRFLRAVRAKFASLSPGDHAFSVKIGSMSVNFRARIVTQPKKLLFTFHGSVNREASKKLPFNSFFPGLEDTHQVAISDPTLMCAPHIRVGWYAGYDDFDVQFHLRGALRTITSALKIDHAIYFGNSAGGFAALYYSYFSPGSIALVFNPQTSIPAYHGTHVNTYRSSCWPQLTTNNELSSVICSDVGQLYAEGFRNTVIYCQSMGDSHHNTRHMLPFIKSIAGLAQSRRFLLYSDYKGVDGHVSDYESFRDWARAVASCPSDDPKELLNIWHVVRNLPKLSPDESAATGKAPASSATTTSTSASAAPKPAFRLEDIETARRLRAFQGASK